MKKKKNVDSKKKNIGKLKKKSITILTICGVFLCFLVASFSYTLYQQKLRNKVLKEAGVIKVTQSAKSEDTGEIPDIDLQIGDIKTVQEIVNLIKEKGYNLDEPDNQDNMTEFSGFEFFSISNEEVVTIDEKNNIIALSEGDAIMDFSYNGIEYSVEINVDTLESKATTNTNRLRKLGSITLTKPVLTVKSPNEYCKYAQGFTVAEHYYVATKICKNWEEMGESPAYVFIYDFTQNPIKKVRTFKKNEAFKHANDLTYIPDTGRIYVAMTTDGIFRTFSLDDVIKSSKMMGLASEKYFINNKLASFTGVAYDTFNKKMYTAHGSWVYVYTNPNKLDLKFKKVDRDTAQGIGAYKGKILVARYNKQGVIGDIDKTYNAIDIYRASNGEYLGSYEIIIPYTLKDGKIIQLELESLAYNPITGKFALYTTRGKIYEVDLKIPE